MVALAALTPCRDWTVALLVVLSGVVALPALPRVVALPSLSNKLVAWSGLCRMTWPPTKVLE